MSPMVSSWSLFVSGPMAFTVIDFILPVLERDMGISCMPGAQTMMNCPGLAFSSSWNSKVFVS